MVRLEWEGVVSRCVLNNWDVVVFDMWLRYSLARLKDNETYQESIEHSLDLCPRDVGPCGEQSVMCRLRNLVHVIWRDLRFHSH